MIEKKELRVMSKSSKIYFAVGLVFYIVLAAVYLLTEKDEFLMFSFFGLCIFMIFGIYNDFYVQERNPK